MADQTSRADNQAQPPSVPTSRRLQGETIGKVLRAQYESVLAEPVPPDLLNLLNALEKREAES